MRWRARARVLWAWAAAVYAWPLDLPPSPTSSFGEYRSGHYHGGLDFSTEQRVGHPVRAVLDGEVARVRASGGGYGRALYLRLDDGRLAVYGHLDAFAPDLAEWVAAAQESSGRYEIDRVPPAGRFRYRRGDIVAWSGESGAGPPHLHFELREGETGINPQRAGFDIDDRVAPVVNALWAYPAAAHARVRDDVVPVRVGVRRDAATYRLTERLRVRGPVRFALQASDRTQLRPNALGLYAASAALDGEVLFEARLDSASWLAATEVDVVYDPLVRRAGGGAALALTPTPGLRDSVVRRGRPAWEPSPGIHALAIEVADASGNRSRLVGEIEWLAGDTIAATAPRRRGAGGLAVEVGLGSLTARAGDGVELRTVPPLADAGPQAAGARTWAVPPGYDGPLHVQAVRRNPGGAETVVGERRLRLAEIRPGWQQSVASPDGRFTLEVGSESAFSPQVVAVYETEVTPSPSAPFGRVYHVLPDWLVLRAPWKVALALEDSGDTIGLGLFEAGSTGSLLGGMDSSGTRLAGSTRRTGSFTARYDNTPPVVGVPRVRSGRAAAAPGMRATPFSVSWSLRDSDAGVSASDVVVEVDGRAVPVEYDLESAALVWRPRVRPTSGRHSYRIEARDRLGARALRSGDLRVP